MESVTRTRKAVLDESGSLIVQGYDLRYALTTILAAERRVLGMSELVPKVTLWRIRRHVQELDAIRRSVFSRQAA